VVAFSFVVTFLIGKLVSAVMGLRLEESAEYEGLDTSQHAETAYELGLVLARGRAAARAGGTTSGAGHDTSVPTPALGGDS
jgi:ammonium transporter, Amt family